MSRLAQYYLSNYSKCPEIESIIESPQFLTIFAHSLSLFSTPLGIYGIYLILKVTPMRMKNIKYVMLNLHLSTTWLDSMFTTITIPHIFLPSGAVGINGVSHYIGIPFKASSYTTVLAAGIFALSILMIFETRHRSIQAIKYRLKKRIYQRIFYFLEYSFNISILLVPFLDNTDQETAKLRILEFLPCPTIDFFETRAGVVQITAGLIGLSFSLVFVSIFFPALFFCLQGSYYMMRVEDVKISTRTRQLQKRFFVILIVQIAIPMLILATPFLIGIGFLVRGSYSGIINNTIIIGLSLHGPAAHLSLIFLHKPYRDFTIQLITCRSQGTAATATTTCYTPSTLL